MPGWVAMAVTDSPRRGRPGEARAGLHELIGRHLGEDADTCNAGRQEA